MISLATIAATAIVATAPFADEPSVGMATDAAFATCEHWLLSPNEWASDIGAFPVKSGLTRQGLTALTKVPDVALPPPALRRAMHHWRIPMGDGGILVTVSDQAPICHLAGGGPFDLQPSVNAVLASTSFLKRWKAGKSETRDDMLTTSYVNVTDPKLSMTVSRSVKAGDRSDRVQMIATAQYDVGN